MRKLAGEVTIAGRGVINLPARVLQSTGWAAGDHLYLEVLDDELIILSRKPAQLADALAGRLTHLFPDPEDTRRFLQEERASWGEAES